MPDTCERIYGRITRVFFTGDDGWMAGRIAVEGKYAGSEKFTGNVVKGVRCGSSVVMDADWVEHAKYGYQWQAAGNTFIHLSPGSEKELAAMCSADKALRKIGKAGVAKLWKAYGRDAILELDTRGAEAVLEAGCSDSDAGAAKDAVDAKGPLPVLLSELPHLKRSQAERIAADMLNSRKPAEAKSFAETCIKSMRAWDSPDAMTDPYWILQGWWGLSFPVSDEIFMEDLNGRDFS